MSIKIILSGDGSHTLFVDELNETYHSTKGAMAESEYVFIEHGLAYCKDSKALNIFEVGFGTGLNALLTCLAAKKMNIKVDYVSIEAYPLQKEIVSELNYGGAINEAEAQYIFDQLHEVKWGEKVEINTHFSITKMHEQLADCNLPVETFNMVYYDAFAPSKQPEMWHIDLLRKVTASLKPGGILVTYCANGQFKRDLKTLGLTVETLPGPLGKKEMTRAIKS
jgi:tRNA U34 5-methylaminomethyl-2-thiouridine-forming methyltransferase MnmC